MCVKNCKDYPGFIKVANRCFFGNSTDSEAEVVFGSLLQAITEDIFNSWLSILISCIVALVFSYILLVLFRYAIKYVIWVIYIGLIVLLLIGSIVMLVFYFSAKNEGGKTAESATGLAITSGVLALLAVLLALFIYFYRRRIQLVIQLFKEASKALSDVPLIVTEPLLTFVAFGLSTVVFLYFALIIQSSGRLEVENDVNGKFLKATYAKDVAVIMAHWLNLIAFLWFTQFILGCQHFVIAGTLCQWFFTRTKSKLDSPIKRSFDYLVRFHIGSVCLGSIFITIMTIIRMIVRGIQVKIRDII